MPTPNYQTGLIYKLVHKEDYDNENIYIGSTTNFRGRKGGHKYSCNNINDKCHNQMKYQIIRETGWDNWDMIQIEPFPCNSKKELESRERYWVDFYKPNLNKKVPTRTTKEYKKDNKEIIEKVSKIWRENNAEKVKAHKKKWVDNNIEKRKEVSAKYYNKIKEKSKEKITCECGCVITKGSLTRHLKTKTHLDLMAKPL